ARMFAAAIVILLAGVVTNLVGADPHVRPGPTHGSAPTMSGLAISEFKPVTDAAILNSDPADWPNWRRTLDGWGYSPLKQIDTRNVQQLQLVWSWGLKPGLSQPNPLVANGMMYVPSPGGGVQTLDAVTGDLLWEFTPKAANGDP